MEQHNVCPPSVKDDFNSRTDGIKLQMLRVNGLTLGNAMLAGILIGIGTYGTRYRHRAFPRALFQLATTLFLPILSYVASNASTTVSTFGRVRYTPHPPPHTGDPPEIQIYTSCIVSVHLFLVLTWAALVHIVGINTCTTVATSDREGRNIGLPMVLLVQAIWTSYLVVSLRSDIRIHGFTQGDYLLPAIFLLVFTKLALRYYQFQMARRSVAFGRNPLLIVGYIEKLQGGLRPSPIVEHYPPPLIVMGEDRTKVEKGPHGFFFKWMLCDRDDMNTMMNNSGLVTVDKIWMLDDMLLTSAPWLRELCLSFALFKLLRCRFAGYTIAEAGFQEVHGFFLHVLLKDNDHERLHNVITNELSFLHDYYYSSIPIHYSKSWLPVVNMFISLVTISCSLLHAVVFMNHAIVMHLKYGDETNEVHEGIFRGQIRCYLGCTSDYYGYESVQRSFGNVVFDMVPVLILLLLVVLAEAREIASNICSNWTKISLICRYVANSHDTWEQSPLRKWVGRILLCRYKLTKHWDDKMDQCSVLVLHPRRSDPIIARLTHLLRLPDTKKNVKVPGAVKAAIQDALRSNNGFLVHPTAFLRRSPEVRSNNILWACESKGIADIILMWHIATTILVLRRWRPPHSDEMIVATHLSRYCAYLVACVPELLPDDDEWCKSLYKAVKKDSMLALASGPAAATAEDEYNGLVSLLQDKAEHEVLRNGVKLGKKLAELREGEAAAWRLLAGFWSQMILYIAPSDNLSGHADAIARGGELITVVWALLMHVGIASRPTTAGPTATGHTTV